MFVPDIGEKLYLSKGNRGNVYIFENFAPHLLPFQRDGIRFLYRQFSKGSAGAILNDPAGCGKTVQVVLLLAALRSVLRPLASLVLCPAPLVQYWRYHFHLWTDCAADVLDDSNNVFSKKDFFVCATSSETDVLRRDWGIVVVDGVDARAHIKQLKQLKAKYKIWITNESLADNLGTLSSIYSWLHPNKKLDLRPYEKTGKTLSEQAEADISLDIFSQDLIVKCFDEDVPLADEQKQKELFQRWIDCKNINREEYWNALHARNIHGNALEKTENFQPYLDHIETIPRVAEILKKNKDASGLKIKRSRKINSDQSEMGDNPFQEVNCNEHGSNKKLKWFGNDNNGVKTIQSNATGHDLQSASNVHNENDNLVDTSDVDSDQSMSECTVEIKRNHEILSNKSFSEFLNMEMEAPSFAASVDKQETTVESLL